jgi:hypothetical protein
MYCMYALPASDFISLVVLDASSRACLLLFLHDYLCWPCTNVCVTLERLTGHPRADSMLAMCWEIYALFIDAFRLLALGVCFCVVIADGCTLSFSICFSARTYML